MIDLFWLTDEQMAKLSPFFPRSHGKPRVDDKRVLSGIYSSIAMGCGGVTLPKNTDRTRRFIAGGSVGVRKVSSLG